MKIDALIIGGGPAGLTAADEFLRHGVRPLVIEASTQWGGIARTVRWQGHRVDIGGHRFFTKDATIQGRWQEWLGHDLLEVPRLSRIFYRGKYYPYPLKLPETVANFGLGQSVVALTSYLWAKARPVRPERSFEDWVTNRFGRHLYLTFFKAYTEKVWGMPCSEISADWAAQRIHGLSLTSAVLGSLSSTQGVKSLIKTFHYPRLGPGMMWEKVAQLVQEGGGETWQNSTVAEVRHEAGRVTQVLAQRAGRAISLRPERLVSTMPLGSLVRALLPSAPPHVLQAARSLRHRDFLIVTLVVRAKEIFPDNWLYIHDPQFRVGRVQNFRNWSVEMVADPEVTTLGMEYFCSRGDELWELEDDALIRLATREMVSLGFAPETQVEGGFVIRQPNAYPVYDDDYAGHVSVVRDYLAGFENLATVGRSGMHRYNNQDHSMLSAMSAVHQLLGKGAACPWTVNTEKSGHEERAQEPCVRER